MAARGYDDTAHIAEIDTLMRANPTMSRKAAIRQVAGDESLSRIEAKMVKRDAASHVAGGAEDIVIPMRPTPTQTMLARAEELALAGTGERVRWSGFNDLAVLAEVRSRRETPLPLPVRLCMSGLVVAVFGILSASILSDRVEFEASLALASVIALLGLPLVSLFGLAYVVCDAVIAAVKGTPRPPIEYSRNDLAPVREHDNRRFTLTDKAFYVLSPGGADVRIRRYASGMPACLQYGPDGEPSILFGSEKVSLESVAGAKALLTRMGLLEGDRAEPSGVAVPG